MSDNEELSDEEFLKKRRKALWEDPRAATIIDAYKADLYRSGVQPKAKTKESLLSSPTQQRKEKKASQSKRQNNKQPPKLG